MKNYMRALGVLVFTFLFFGNNLNAQFLDKRIRGNSIEIITYFAMKTPGVVYSHYVINKHIIYELKKNKLKPIQDTTYAHELMSLLNRQKMDSIFSVDFGENKKVCADGYEINYIIKFNEVKLNRCYSYAYIFSGSTIKCEDPYTSDYVSRIVEEVRKLRKKR